MLIQDDLRLYSFWLKEKPVTQGLVVGPLFAAAALFSCLVYRTSIFIIIIFFFGPDMIRIFKLVARGMLSSTLNSIAEVIKVCAH